MFDSRTQKESTRAIGRRISAIKTFSRSAHAFSRQLSRAESCLLIGGPQ